MSSILTLWSVPICLFIDAIVLSGFVIACLFAVSPTNLSPLFVKATMDGVVLFPSAFGITTGSPPSKTETHEFVVPKSIPITLPIFFPPYKSWIIFDFNNIIIYFRLKYYFDTLTMLGLIILVFNL